MNIDGWLESQNIGKVIVATAALSGIAGVIAHMRHSDGWPPAAVMVKTFGGSFLLGLVICFLCWSRWEDTPSTGIWIALLAGLGGQQSIEFLLLLGRRVLESFVRASLDNESKDLE